MLLPFRASLARSLQRLPGRLGRPSNANPVVCPVSDPLLLRQSKKIARTADALLSPRKISHFFGPALAPGRP